MVWLIKLHYINTTSHLLGEMIYIYIYIYIVSVTTMTSKLEEVLSDHSYYQNCFKTI